LNGDDRRTAKHSKRRKSPWPRKAFTMTPFGIATNERVIAGDITIEEAEAIIVEHYRAIYPET
jgi:hypothetical protein